MLNNNTNNTKIDNFFKLNTTIILTADQQNALDGIKKFLDVDINVNDDETFMCVLYGSAGVGKTTITKHIVDYILSKHNVTTIIALAMTHKARKVLDKTLNTERFLSIPTSTIASVLGKMKGHSYIGTKRYESKGNSKMDKFNFFIIDEISMVADNDFKEIVNFARVNRKKVLCIGDNCQIPSPSQKLKKIGDKCYRMDCCAFDLPLQFELKEIVRQKSDSIIIKIATYIRDNLSDDFYMTDVKNSIIDDSSNTFEMNLINNTFITGEIDGKSARERFKDVIQYYYSNNLNNNTNNSNFMLEYPRIVTYTNASVKTYNEIVRKILHYDDPFVVGDIMMGYTNVGFPEMIIENGQDYIIEKVEYINNHFEYDYGMKYILSGHYIHLDEIGNDFKKMSNKRRIFIPDVNDNANEKFLNELCKRAEKVNSVHSTKNDFKSYA